ncbi:protein kinase [Lipomyces kononenkoae]|uniref:Protein kinase n=1 Tax=Lipomyces kononenkoae TaxID=34357 RepID=A0ACC3SS00_LIPKO
MTRSLRCLFEPSPLDHIEDIENYKSGGFHPLLIGDKVAGGRYRILHKLGSGEFSTVWLARDERGKRLVSLKIMSAETSSTCNELRTVQYLKQTAVHHPACTYILSVLDHFEIEDPNGRHVCLVSEFAGPNISALHFNPDKPGEIRRLRGDLARKYSKQLILVTGYLHSVGIVHGDITTSNVLIQLASADEWTDQDVYQRLGYPVPAEVRLCSGELNDLVSAPKYVVESARLPDLESTWLTEKIVLVDFGQAFMLQTPPCGTAVLTVAYAPPEVIFESKLSVWSDIWALACTIFEIRAGFQLFEIFSGTSREVLRHMVEILGKFPEPWWSSWEERNVYFDDDGKPKKSWPDSICLSEEHSLTETIRDIGENESKPTVPPETCNSNSVSIETKSIFGPPGIKLSETEVENFADLLHKVMRYCPEQRLPIEEILEHPWVEAFDSFSAIDEHMACKSTIK